MSLSLAPSLENTESKGNNILAEFETLAVNKKRARAKSIRVSNLKGFRKPEIQSIERIVGEGRFGLKKYEVIVNSLR